MRRLCYQLCAEVAQQFISRVWIHTKSILFSNRFAPCGPTANVLHGKEAVFIEASYLVLMAPSADVCQAIRHEGSWAIRGAPPGDGAGDKDGSSANALLLFVCKACT